MIHHVYANRSNIGDWLSARGIQRLLAPLPVTEHLCDDPFVGATLAALSRAGADDLVVIGGGGLLMDYFTPFWHGLLALPNRPRYLLWGVGCCDLKAEASLPDRSLTAAVVAGAVRCELRDDLSRGFVGDLALPPAVACPALFELVATQPGSGLLHVDNYTTVGATAFDRMDAEGRQFSRRSGRRYRRTNNQIEPGSAVQLADCLALYRDADIVLSSALHGCIIAVAMGRQLVAVSGDRKIDAFMAAAGLADWVIDHRDLDALPERLAALPRQRDALGWAEGQRQRQRGIAAAIAALASARSETARRAGANREQSR